MQLAFLKGTQHRNTMAWLHGLAGSPESKKQEESTTSTADLPATPAQETESSALSDNQTSTPSQTNTPLSAGAESLTSETGSLSSAPTSLTPSLTSEAVALPHVQNSASQILISETASLSSTPESASPALASEAVAHSTVSVSPSAINHLKQVGSIRRLPMQKLVAIVLLICSAGAAIVFMSNNRANPVMQPSPQVSQPINTAPQPSIVPNQTPSPQPAGANRQTAVSPIHEDTDLAKTEKQLGHKQATHAYHPSRHTGRSSSPTASANGINREHRPAF